MNGIKSIGALTLLSLLISCQTKTKEQPSRERMSVSVDVIIADKADFVSNLEVNGTVLSNEMIELHPEVSGRLIYLNIPDGGLVKAGTILARINDADLQAQKEQFKTQLDLAKKTEKRLGDLLRINGVNQADYDAALSQVNTYKANIKIIDAQLDKTIIRAPFAGQLGLRQVSPGAYVTPAILIGTLHQTDKVKIDFAVPETYTDHIQNGNQISVQASGIGKLLTAVIAAIEPQINSATRNIKVRAYLTEGHIQPGAFVKVLLEQNRKVITVPTNSIVPEAYTNQVVIIKNNKAVFTAVETGTRNAGLVEIAKGVNEGDSIVVSGMLYVRPDAFVKVKRVTTASELNK
ncbi:MAG: efflux RND transporter periplasmic adaptor subunit [Mariniphaga sp.]